MIDNDEEQIKKISRMLEIGATMLSQHCENCNSPMFRYKGEIMCPVCKDNTGTGVVAQQTTSTSPQVALERKSSMSSEHIVPHRASGPVQTSTRIEEKGPHHHTPAKELEMVLLEKMIALGRSMQDETDMRRIGDVIELIERGVSVIKEINKLQ